MESILLLLNSAPTSSNAERTFETALQLSSLGHHVSIYLLQDAVLAGLNTGENGMNQRTSNAMQAGIAMYANDEDLQLRGFTPNKLFAGIYVADYSQLVDLFEKHTRVIGAL